LYIPNRYKPAEAWKIAALLQPAASVHGRIQARYCGPNPGARNRNRPVTTAQRASRDEVHRCAQIAAIRQQANATYLLASTAPGAR
jgi:hypothetical protein